MKSTEGVGAPGNFETIDALVEFHRLVAFQLGRTQSTSDFSIAVKLAGEDMLAAQPEIARNAVDAVIAEFMARIAGHIIVMPVAQTTWDETYARDLIARLLEGK